jgi:hypothetical protein
MVYFHTKNPRLGVFRKALERTTLVYFVAVWNILQPIGCVSCPLDIFWYFGKFSPRFGMLYQEKSGNPGMQSFSAGHCPFIKAATSDSVAQELNS